MLALVVLLTLVGVYIEIRLVSAAPAWFGNFLTRHRDAALVLSILLSVVLGSLFGAAGMIVAAAGIASAVATQPWYVMRQNGQLDRLRSLREERRERLALWWEVRRERFSRRYSQLRLAVKLALKIAALPFAAVGLLLDFAAWITTRMSQPRS